MKRVVEPSSRTGVAPVSDFEPENGNPWFRVSLGALRSLWLNLFSINRKEHKERRDKFPGDTWKAGLAGCLGRLNFKILFLRFILSTA